MNDDPVHAWFGLTYSAYLVVPRLALTSMPVDWQRRFAALMNEALESGMETPDDYEVRRRRHGRFITDPWADYRHGDADAILKDTRE